MESLQNIFNNKLEYNGKKVLIIIDEENNPRFKAKYIAKILEYKNTTDAIIKHVDNEDKMNYSKFEVIAKRDDLNIDEKTSFINESGLYSLILSSKKQEAKRFKNGLIQN